jgi:predicted nucleic acid-binding protein
VAVDCLLDTNILVRLVVPNDPLAHTAQTAVRFLKERQDRLFIATQSSGSIFVSVEDRRRRLDRENRDD